MPFSATITLTSAGLDLGPFDLYSDVDAYASPFETGVSRSSLVAGYTSTVVPDNSTIIKIMSTGVCVNFILQNIGGVITTTTTTTRTICVDCGLTM